MKAGYIKSSSFIYHKLVIKYDFSKFERKKNVVFMDKYSFAKIFFLFNTFPF